MFSLPLGLIFGNTVRTWGQVGKLFFDVLLTVHLSIFIAVFNQIDAQNLFHNKFYFVPLHVSSTCARNTKMHEIKLIVKQILCIKLVKY